MHSDDHRADGLIDYDGSSTTCPAATRATLPRFFRGFTAGGVLRQVEAADAARVWKSALHPGFALCFTDAPPSSLHELEALVRQSHDDWKRGRSYTLAMQQKGTQDLVGTLSLTAGPSADHWLLDWFIHPRFVATDAARELLDAACTTAFRTLGGLTVGVRCPAARPHFEALLARAGFTAVAGAPGTERWHVIDAVQWAALCAPASGVETSHWAPAAPRLDLQLL